MLVKWNRDHAEVTAFLSMRTTLLHFQQEGDFLSANPTSPSTAEIHIKT
jgi:hypothetical protein